MPILAEPRDLAELTEIDPVIPPGAGDRFSGYGVMGLPFDSGQILALRRFPASSLGTGYSSVWHRDAEGRWTFWSDHLPESSCARYFGCSISHAVIAPISVRWIGPRSFRVRVGGGVVDWTVTLAATPASLLLQALRLALPEHYWRRPHLLRRLSRLAGPLFNAGELRLTGRSSNGQYFMAMPERVWMVSASVATVHSTPLGSPRPLPEQAFLGDFAIPQRGLFMVGSAEFERFDPARHSSLLSCQGAPASANRAASAGLPSPR